MTKEEKYLVNSMNVPDMPNVSSMWRTYAEAIVKARKAKAKEKNMGVKGTIFDNHGPEDNSINNLGSMVEDGTEISIFSVHINTICMSILMMVDILILVCLLGYLLPHQNMLEQIEVLSHKDDVSPTR